MQRPQVVDVHPQALDDLRRDLKCALAQLPAGVGQRDREGAVVVGMAVASDQVSPLQTLEQWRESGGVEAQELTDLLDGQGISLPEGEHDEILRMREPERREHLAVEGDDVARGRDQGEADLAIEGEEVVIRFGPRQTSSGRSGGDRSTGTGGDGGGLILSGPPPGAGGAG